MAMNVVDIMIVGRLSAVALASVAIGTVYIFALGSFGMGVLTVLDPILFQAVGARDEIAITRGLQRGLVIAGGLGVVAGAVLLPAEHVLLWLGQPPELVHTAMPFILVHVPAMLAFFITVAFRQRCSRSGECGRSSPR